MDMAVWFEGISYSAGIVVFPLRGVGRGILVGTFEEYLTLGLGHPPSEAGHSPKRRDGQCPD